MKAHEANKRGKNGQKKKKRKGIKERKKKEKRKKKGRRKEAMKLEGRKNTHTVEEQKSYSQGFLPPKCNHNYGDFVGVWWTLAHWIVWEI